MWPWSRDGIERRDGNARTTCRMIMLIWKTIIFKHPSFPAHRKKPCIVGSTCLLRPWEWQIQKIGSPIGTDACWQPLGTRCLLRTTSLSLFTQGNRNRNQTIILSQNSTTTHIYTSTQWTYWKPSCLSSTQSSLCPSYQWEQTRTC